MKPVSVNVLTGFLGSGKTTLLRRFLAEAGGAGERVAVIMNEVGDVGIDGRVVEGFEHLEQVVELEGGCICCSIEEYRFDLAVQELLRRSDPTQIVIETTGVADPEPLLERVRRAGLGVDSVICTVDATSFGRLAWRYRVLRRQVRSADFLLLTKTDLVSPAQSSRLERKLARLSGRAAILRAEPPGRGLDDRAEGGSLPAKVPDAERRDAGVTRGAAEREILFSAGVRRFRERSAAAGPASGVRTPEGVDPAETIPAAPTPEVRSETASGPEFESFVWRGRHAVDRGGFEAFLSDLPAGVLRAKGVVRFHGADGAWLFNLTCGRFDVDALEWPGREWALEAVFIGRGIAACRDEIERALAALEDPPMRIADGGAEAKRR